MVCHAALRRLQRRGGAAEWSFKDFMVGDWDMERQKDGMQAPCLSPFVLLARLKSVH